MATQAVPGRLAAGDHRAAAVDLYGIAIVYSAGQTDIPTAVGRLWKTQIDLVRPRDRSAAYAVTRCSVRLLDWLTWPAYWLVDRDARRC